MNIWIFNPYEPLPFEGTARLRYASLAAALVEKGCSVTWWSADWSHGQKRRRSSPLLDEGDSRGKGDDALKLEIIPVKSYHKNISFRRVWSHLCYARGIAKRAASYAEAYGSPNLIIFSVPPMEAGLVALKLGKKFGAKVVLDVMDAWPDALRLALDRTGNDVQGTSNSSFIRLLSSVLLYPYSQMMRRYCRRADSICAQSQAFAAHAAKYGAKGEIPVFHLAAHKRLQANNVELPNEERWPPLRLVYLGSMGRFYDLKTVVQAVGSLVKEGFDVRLDLIGEGEQRGSLAELVKSIKVENAVRIHGYLHGDSLDQLMGEADIGIIPMHPASGVVIPYKAPHYLSYGLYIISSLPGELMGMLERNKCGSFYQAGDPRTLKQQILSLIERPEIVTGGRDKAIQLFNNEFESERVYSGMADWLMNMSVA